MASLEEIQAEASRRGLAPAAPQDAVRAEAIRRGLVDSEVTPQALPVPGIVEAAAPPSAVLTAAPDPGSLGEQQPETEQKRSEAASEANEILGLDPAIIRRGAILPFGVTAEGETVLAVPEIALDVARSILLPGQVMRGVAATPEDVLNLALTTTGGAVRGIGTLKTVTKAKQITARQIADAPTSLDLTKASGKKYTASRQSGGFLKPDDYVGFLAGAERDMIEEGMDAALHPELASVFNVLTKKIGAEDLDARQLHNIRRTIGIATGSLKPDEARIARVLRDNFDDFVENLPGTPAWVEARKLYASARRLETVETAIIKAGNQSSGLENGLRIQFRQILNNPRAVRGFTKQEKAAMQAVVDGDFTANNLKRLGRLGVGRGQQQNFIGLATGIFAGGAIGGPIGSVAAVGVGQLALRGAERRTQRAADLVRALIGGVRPETVTKLTDPALAARTLAGPLVATQDEAQ